MSSAQVSYHAPDGHVIGYGVFYGVAATLEPQVCETPDEAWAVHNASRGGPPAEWKRDETCQHPRLQRAYAFSDYGWPDHWPCILCLACMSVREGFGGYGGEYGYEPPSSAEEYRDWLLKAGGFPKPGPPPNSEAPPAA